MVAVERTADGRDVLAIFVCDGVGSAAQGEPEPSWRCKPRWTFWRSMRRARTLN